MSVCPICEQVIDTGQPTTWRLFNGEAKRVHGLCVYPTVTRRPMRTP
jgi:hypothetical protein